MTGMPANVLITGIVWKDWRGLPPITFNVAVAEAGTEESLTRLRLAVVSISNSERHLRSRMDKCCLMLEAVSPEEMIDSEVEIYAAD